MMLMNETPTKIQKAYNLAAAVIVANDERDYWNDLSDCVGADFTAEMHAKCSARIQYAIKIAKDEGLYQELLDLTLIMLEADEWHKLKSK